MQLEFHQLERRLEHLRAHRPDRQQRLLASLAASGQQTPIIVIATDQPERYLLIDGYRRVRALEQLGRDTVEAVVWWLSEAEALFLDRSMRAGEQATALEEGWLLAEMSERFGYDQEELARRFDRSVSWVSRRMGLVELLPAAVQQQVRSGAITAHVAMKFLVPVARLNAEDCCRMAEGFARHRLRSREAGQLYAAWRGATAAVRQRLLADPQLFLKTQRQREKSPAAPAMVELSRDLEVVIAMVRRANRRLRGATVELDLPQCAQTQAQIRLALEELNRLAIKLPHPSATGELRSNREHESHEEITNLSHQGGEDAESDSTRGDPGDACAKTEQPHDRAVVEGEPLVCTRGVATEHDGGSCAGARRDLRALPAADHRAVAALQEQSCSRAGGTGGDWSDAVLLGVDSLLPPPWDRAGADRGIGTLSVSVRNRDAARHISTQGGSGGHLINLYGRSIGAAFSHRFLPGTKGGLYAWEKVRQCPEVIVVEGLFDYAALRQAGFDNVTCSLGTHLNADQFLQLCDGPRTVYLTFDADANQSGQQAAEQLAHRLEAHGVAARRVLLPQGHDPNSFFVQGGDARQFLSLVEGAQP